MTSLSAREMGAAVGGPGQPRLLLCGKAAVLLALAMLFVVSLPPSQANASAASDFDLAKEQTRSKIVDAGDHVIKNSCRSMGKTGQRGVKCNWVSARLSGGTETRNCRGSSLLEPGGRQIRFQTKRCSTDKGATAVNSLLPQKLADAGIQSQQVFCFTTLGSGYLCDWQGLRHQAASIDDCTGTGRSANRQITFRITRCEPNQFASGVQGAVKTVLNGLGLTPGLVSCTPGAPTRCSWSASKVSGGWTYSCEGQATASTGAPPQLTPCDLHAPDLAPLGSGSGQPTRFGVNEIWQAMPSNQEVRLADDFHADTARFSITWESVEQVPGVFDWHSSDAIYQRMRAAGLEPTVIISGAPCWAAIAGCKPARGIYPPSPVHIAEWAVFAAAVAARYRDVAAIEVWNEANADFFYAGGPDPAGYAQLLKTAYTAIKAAAPATPVLTTGTAAFVDTGNGRMRYDDFLRRVYQALGPGARSFSDGIAHHAYPGGGPTADIVSGVRRQIADIKDVMFDFGDQDKPIWITETGVSTTGDAPYTEAQQAKAYAGLYNAFQRIPGIAAVITHRWRDDPSAPKSSPEAGWGLVRANYSKRPVYCALAQARTGADPGGCH